MPHSIFDIGIERHKSALMSAQIEHRSDIHLYLPDRQNSVLAESNKPAIVAIPYHPIIAFAGT
jgi:hypothetical protein